MGRSAGCADENGLLPTRGCESRLRHRARPRPGAMPGGVPEGWAALRSEARVRRGSWETIAAPPESAALAGAAVALPLPAAMSIAASSALSRDLSGPLPGTWRCLSPGQVCCHRTIHAADGQPVLPPSTMLI